MPSLEALVDEYVDTRRWDTLVGRAWCLNDDSSRKDFKKFLTKQFSEFFKFANSKEKVS